MHVYIYCIYPEENIQYAGRDILKASNKQRGLSL